MKVIMGRGRTARTPPLERRTFEGHGCFAPLGGAGDAFALQCSTRGAHVTRRAWLQVPASNTGKVRAAVSAMQKWASWSISLSVGLMTTT